ncbi:MAG TPA: single-stranded-DNA-specific exonuclease RecJ [Sediminibacterium sp.]|uniref:single-stranded-DNA-specific exonuclease RecJ n=1 Tax=Sediminibacterium sp. TaxID=1917865 RepID=UPI0008AD71F7|nr:single-stranded-DNA-specific exonuclease RecJ [Sediminibacterium sp.]OHC85789.1 MAG: single-stranded-DNA-specific exonuclease RecJ [Sphingobacteriia bacterium RIFOXYC2_FULL_35_18]OHC87325.1 MAG: single-stranded-DNA-specific exonuclease RecJ [Sphingobacteriia bacterium RIFOXYD2_FULL_35_12]HLD52560.1 single-stranded-DNA-specific exonuclease RecJ [Sediminibacterium sp.]
MQKRWNILSANPAEVASLQDSLKINATLCTILAQRGINDYDKAKEYFRPSLEHLHSPWLMKDMDKAVERILHAFNNQEQILVYGDYDVDGTTSVASMFQFLKSLHDPIDFYIPHRYKEGYGISKIGIDFAKENGFSLIISLDCGIKSADLIAYAKSLGIDFIVCDHHLPDEIIPAAVAILNPKQKDCNYPYKELCGCGVGFKLMTALTEHLKLNTEAYLQYIDLVAIAIAADIVPVTGENRTLAFFGIQKVNTKPSIGIEALLNLSKAKFPMSLTSLVFVIAPRINAAGRMDDAKKAVQLFIEKDPTAAITLANILHSDNTDRREADSSITIEAMEMLAADPNNINRKTSVLYNENWHKGVVGIVASRLIETFYRPTIILTKSGDYAAGSARSVAGFNLYEAIHACRKYLLGYGGHFAAAGMTISIDQIEAFSIAFEEEVAKTIQPDQLIPEIVINTEISFKDIHTSLYNIIKQMEPFGPDNMRPVFIARKVKDAGFSKVVKDLHLRVVLKQEDIILSGIGFNMADKFSLLENSKPVDIVFAIDENEWQGNTSLQLKIIDLLPASSAQND